MSKLSAARGEARCAIETHLRKTIALERSAPALLSRHPWVKGTLEWCTGLAMGTADEQGRFVSACLARRCETSGGCSADIQALASTVTADARTRAQLQAERKSCEALWAADVFRKQGTAMDAFVNRQLSMVVGHEQRVRQLSMGSEDDFELTQSMVEVMAAKERFFDGALRGYGPVAAELARVQLAVSMPNRPPSLDTLEWIEDPQGVTIRAPETGVKARFVRDEGRWKVDLDAEIRANPQATPALMQLMAFAFEEGTRYLDARRAASPTIAVNAVMQCNVLGMFVVQASVDDAKRTCAEFMAGRLQ